MQFRTTISLRPSGLDLDHSQRGLMIGSCFSEHICDRMRRAGFRVAQNPFGIMFNPASICSVLRRLASGEHYAESDLTEEDGRWFSFDFHGDFASRSAEQAVVGMNRAIDTGAEALQNADYVVLTLGTAWVYRLADGRVAANCHKMPQSMFRRELLSVGQIVDVLSQSVESTMAGKRVVLTVSPVRHVGDGLDGNFLSKATLRVAAARLAERYPAVSYFPAYEILCDDLRDYRFYDSDMVHPSPVAVEYIWQQWAEWALAHSARQPAFEAERISTAARHRPSDPDSEEYRRFCRSMLERLDRLAAVYPQVNWDAWRGDFAAGGRG